MGGERDVSECTLHTIIVACLHVHSTTEVYTFGLFWFPLEVRRNWPEARETGLVLGELHLS